MVKVLLSNLRARRFPTCLFSDSLSKCGGVIRDIVPTLIGLLVAFVLGVSMGVDLEVRAETTPITFHVEEECFFFNDGERLKMKRLTMRDLERM